MLAVPDATSRPGGDGYGKTAAFCLTDDPAAGRGRGGPPQAEGPRAGAHARAGDAALGSHPQYARGTGIPVVPLYGGASMEQQIRSLSRGADIAVATPAGRSITSAARHSPSMRSACHPGRGGTRCWTLGFAEDLDVFSRRRPKARQAARFPPRCRRASCRLPNAPVQPGARDDAGETDRDRQAARIRQVALRRPAR